ncbi:MAG: glycosyltransferase, partial [Burkholderiales bacterium]|nr:glycosyltransferase [Burkholderiales bacterium]
LREARLFAFPSLTEGFGIPVLEAQSMGCPVMTSNVSAIPEIVGSTAALINDPLNVDEIVSVLDATVADDYLCDQLRSDGLVNSQRFSKESFSHRLDDLIQSLN